MKIAMGVVALILVAGCGDDSSPKADAAPGSGPDAAPGIDGGGEDPDAAIGQEGYETLISASWSLQPGEEKYVCATRTLPDDVYVGAIRPIDPPGTHHTVVDLDDPVGADNPAFPCFASTGQFYASGVGTEALVMPEGVGLVARRGKQVSINLHLFNASDTVMTGVSGVEVKRLQPSQVQHEATLSFHGPISLSIPSNNQPHVESQTGSISAGRTIFAIFPHMHKAGTYFKAEILRGSQTIPIWDSAYDFETQEFAAIPAQVTQAGDQLRTTCTYVNNTGATIRWGDSSEAEMCFSILMSY